jgi:hypothetical protein
MDKKYNCLLCVKQYASRSSLSNHKKKFHSIIENQNITSTEDSNKYKCRHCENSYTIFQSRWFHEKKCKIISKQKFDTIEKLKQEKDAQYKSLTQKIIKLQDKIIKGNSITTKSFKAINKLLIERSYMSQSNNTNSLNTINNNNIQICNVGTEDILHVLTEKQKKQIMNAKFGALDKLVEITHCGDYNQFKNIVITNLKDEFAYQYDSSKGFFVAVKKNDIIKDIIDYRIYNITEIYDEMENGNKIDAKTKIVLKRFMDRCDSDEPFEDSNGIKHPNYKEYKKDCIKILLYNNHERITKDIATLIQEDNPTEEDEPECLPEIRVIHVE